MIDKLSHQDLVDAQELITQMFNEVSFEERTLTSGTKLGTGGKALKSLRETKVTFGNPTNNLIRLTKKLFDEVGIELTEIRKRQMREQFDFYYMTLTVSMQPKRGALFKRVECSLDFGPKGADEPIVQTIFPNTEWKEVLRWGGGMNLGLDGNFEWRIGVDLREIAKAKKLPGHMKANIANKDGLKAFITVPDYSFKLGRAEITALGEGNSECFWRIEKPSLQETQTVQFGIVFKVPKGKSSIELTGLVAAKPSIDWLVAHIPNVFEDLSDNLQHLLRLKEDERHGKEHLPIGDHERWIITLPN